MPKGVKHVVSCIIFLSYLLHLDVCAEMMVVCSPLDICLMCYDVTIVLTLTQHKKATIRQQTTMLSTSKNVLFPGHNHLLTTIADDPSLIITKAHGGYLVDRGFFAQCYSVLSPRALFPVCVSEVHDHAFQMAHKGSKSGTPMKK